MGNENDVPHSIHWLRRFRELNPHVGSENALHDVLQEFHAVLRPKETKRVRVVLETPLKADTPEQVQENLRYLLWCARAMQSVGWDVIASHLIKPWFLDDSVPHEREAGMRSSWFWLGDAHCAFTDLGVSGGMQWAESECGKHSIPHVHRSLADFPECYSAWRAGEWPPHTEGFRVTLAAV